MILHKPALFFLSLVIPALLMALTLGVAAGSSHVLTDEYIDVEPDGYWDAEVAAGGHQQWSFDLAEARDHNLLIEIENPADASLSVSINGQDLGTVSGVALFTLGLEAGPHAVIINNPGDVPVQYEFYMGSVNVGFSDLEMEKDDGGVSVVPGGTVVYTLTITNSTLEVLFANGVVVHETVPEHTTFNPGFSTPGWVCSSDDAGGTCIFDLGPMVSGTQNQIDFSVDLDTPLAPDVAQIENTASVHAEINGTDPTPDNNVGSDTTPIIRPVGGTTSFLPGGSDSSSGSIALLAAGIAATMAMAAAGWYTRRRWMRS